MKLKITPKIKKELVEWIKVIAISIILVLIINNLVIINANIPSSSMATTIMKGDRLIANRLAYFNSEPQRGDIVIFKYPDDKSLKYVKRIIGLPNEEISIYDNKVYVDGKELLEDYINVEMIGEFGPYNVPEDQYFMLGDNRNNSDDSRKWEISYVVRKDILGKVWLRYFPNIEFIN